MLTIPTLSSLSCARAMGALLAATLLPAAGALAAGIVLGDGDFNVAAGVGVGVVLACGTAVAFWMRTVAEPADSGVPRGIPETSDPDVAEPLGSLPAAGTTARVRAHFGPRGGYVEQDGLLLWAEPAPDTDWAVLRPGRLCRVEPTGDGPVLTVTMNRTNA
jgi:hypothetical protein